MRQTLGALALLATVALPAAAQQRQTDASFHWTGKVAPGRWLRIRDLNGAVVVGQASGDNVEVTATKTWRRGDPATVRIETKKIGAGDEDLVVCALWGERSTCDEHGDESHDDRNDRSNHDNDVSVEFHVLVPKGVKIDARTVNGAVTVDGATADVDAGTINGEVDVATTGGRVNATNVNGNVHARLGRVDADAPSMEFNTVNGSVTVEVAGDLAADIDLRTLTGSVNTNFPMTLTGRINPHRLHAHVGKPGGPSLRLGTVNGNIELRQR